MVYKNSVLNIATVSDRNKKYTIRQIQQAESAREYQRKLGYSSPGQLFKMISHGKLDNGKIVAQDVLRSIVVLYCTYGTYVPYSLSPYRVLNSDTASALTSFSRHIVISPLSS